MSLLQFDEYEIDITHRRVTEHGHPLRLGGRAFDILFTLVSRAGEVISKEELIDLVWPTTTVDEGSLRVHLVALRKTLGDRARRYIETIPGRGYVFAGEVHQISTNGSESKTISSATIDPMSALPRIPRRLIGREEFVRSTLELLNTARFLTIAGPGGIGKTSVAVACAHAFAERKRIVFLDLAVVADGEKLLRYLAAQLGLNAFSDDILPGILAELSKSDTLLLFDSCECIVNEAANCAETLLRASPTTQILATSREPLRARSERVRQLPPLKFPAEDEALLVLRSYPALELFISLATLSGDNIQVEGSSLILAADIVRRLDGIPLAIELAAARAFDMDLPTLHRSIADPMAVLRRGRRTAPPRQQTLRAAIDWSYSTLSDNERNLLLQLSVFAGTFSPEAAMTVAEQDGNADEFQDSFDGLFLKSFFVVTQHGGRFRLLGTTREYAREKLAETPFGTASYKAHALYCLSRLDVAARDWPTTDPVKWRACNADLVPDLRAALTWALATNGDEELAIILTAASDTLWVQFGLIAEHLTMSERALRLFMERGATDASLEMKLRMSYGSALYHSKTFERNTEALVEFHRVLQLAVAENDFTKILRAIVGIAAISTSNGDYQGAIDLVHKFKEHFDSMAPQARSCILNHSYHYIGDLDRGMEHARIALGPRSKGNASTPNSGSQFNPRISVLCTVVKTHWLQGRYSEARSTLADTLAEVIAGDHAISTCLYLAVSAFPTAFGLGDRELGASLLQNLREVSTKNSLLRWRDWGSAYENVLKALKEGDRSLFDRIVAELKGAAFENSLVMAGRLASEKTLQQIAANGNWCGSEILRLRGELLMARSPADGRDLLRAGYYLAARQSGSTFALRCATSILRYSAQEQVESSRERLLRALDCVEYDQNVDDVANGLALL